MPVHIECLRYADNHIIGAIKLVVLISYHSYPVNAYKVCKVVAEQVPFLSVKSNLLTDSGIVADSSQGVNKVEHWFSVLIKDHERCVIEVSVANAILTPTTLVKIRLHPGGLPGAYWIVYGMMRTYLYKRKIPRCDMHPYLYTVLRCVLPGRFWRRPSSISGIADTRRSTMYRTGFVGTGTAGDCCKLRWQIRWA